MTRVPYQCGGSGKWKRFLMVGVTCDSGRALRVEAWFVALRAESDTLTVI